MRKISTLLTSLTLIIGLQSQIFAQVFFSEDFEGAMNVVTDLPVGWTETGLSTDGIWSTGDVAAATSPYLNFPAPGNGLNFAFTNDDACDCDKSNDRMILPVQSFVGMTGINLGFDLYLNGGYGEQGYIMVSTNGGTNWDTVYTATGNAAAWQNGISISLSAYAGNPTVTIAFVYSDAAAWAFAMGVDDVVLEQVSCDELIAISAEGEYTKIPLPLAASMTLEGQFFNVVCGAPVNDAKVVSTVWSSVNGFATPLQSDSSLNNTILPGDTVTINTGTYSPLAVGDYIYRYIVTAPSLAGAADTISYAFEVTSTEYARDDSVISIGLGVTGTGNTSILGNNYSFPVAADVNTVLAGFNALAPGDTTFLYVFNTDPSGMPTTVVASVMHIVTIAGPNVELIQIPGGLSLSPGTYFFGVSEELSVNNAGFMGSNNIFTPATSWGSVNGGPWGAIEDLGFSVTFLIRPVLCSEVVMTPVVGSFCQNEAATGLVGSPVGGSFSGPGVTGSQFDPAAAGPGTHWVTYTHTEGIGCTKSDSVSITVLATTSDTLVQTGCDSLVINAITYTTSGTFTQLFNNAEGCDSTLFLDLTIGITPVISITPLTGPICSTDGPQALNATPPGGSFSGPGVTGTQFDPAVAGVGSHVITYSVSDTNGCASQDTINVTVQVCVGLGNMTRMNVKVYPNPGNGDFVVENIPNGSQVEVINLLGQVLYSKTSDASRMEINLNGLSIGTYNLKIMNGDQVQFRKLIVR